MSVWKAIRLCCRCGRTVAWALVLLLPAAILFGQTSPGGGAGRGETLEAMKARVERSARQLERIRGRKLKRPVPVVLQTAAEFRAYVDKELAHQLPEDLAMKESVALQAFGLLPAGYDLRKGITELYVSQAGAYYDPDTDTFYVLKTNLPEVQLDTLVLHELAHAMQDQYFDLGALREAALAGPNEDARSTLAYVYEGEASYLMMLAQMLQGGKGIDDIPVMQQEMVFQTMRDMTREALTASATSAQPPGSGGDEVRAAVKALSEVPGYLFWGLQDPYLKGQYCIHRVRVAQGWEGVDALFRTPPASTEQVLHPEKLVAPRDEPKPVDLPELSGILGESWAEVYRNTLGEAGVMTFFDAHDPVAKVEASAGWGGDSYVVFRHPSQGLLLFWKTLWDDESEAIQFEKALAAVDAHALCARREGTTKRVARAGAEVLMVAGPDPAAERAFAAGVARAETVKAE